VPFTQNVFPTLPRFPRKGVAQILPADTTAQKTIITAGASGNKVVSLFASSNDTALVNLAVSLVRSATTYLMATTQLPISAGFTQGVPPVDLLALIGGLPLDQDSQKYLFLESGDTLVVNALATITAAKTVSIHADHAEF
jgi:hypothetical protein